MLPDTDGGTVIDASILDDWAARFVAETTAPGAQRLDLGTQGQLLVDTAAGSRNLLQPGPHGWRVRQGGPERIWDPIEDHLLRWRHDGSPALNRFRTTLMHAESHSRTGAELPLTARRHREVPVLRHTGFRRGFRT